LPLTSSNLRTLRQAKPEIFQTISIRIKSSRTYLENFLPPNFAFASLGTIAAASISCTVLNGMSWLAGSGYSHCGLYIHGINYTQRDGSKIFGTYLAVLFENLADPIITGRDELGMPKTFCDIDAGVVGNSASVSLAWRGKRFGQINVSGLTAPQSTPPASEPAQQLPGPPPPPSEQGQFWQRYVPSVGEPGKTDADYAVFNPNPEHDAVIQGGTASSTTLISTNASLAFEACDWQTLPTLHHIAKGLAEMPIYGIEEAKFVKGTGVGDLSSARRIE
jgi:hypothetical protein